MKYKYERYRRKRYEHDEDWLIRLIKMGVNADTIAILTPFPRESVLYVMEKQKVK